MQPVDRPKDREAERAAIERGELPRLTYEEYVRRLGETPEPGETPERLDRRS